MQTDRYKSKRGLEILLIEDAGNRNWSLAAYEFNFQNKKSFGFGKDFSMLDSLQIEKLKSKHNKEKAYSWKAEDIKNFKVTIMSREAFENTIRTAAYIKLPEKLVLYISRPLVIDATNALIFFNSGSSRFGFSTIQRYTMLMKKVNGKWVKDTYYDDGISH